MKEEITGGAVHMEIRLFCVVFRVNKATSSEVKMEKACTDTPLAPEKIHNP